MRRRWIRVLVVLVVVLAGLSVAADRLSVLYAEHRAADAIRNSQDLSSEPSVSIKGFPFLTQVIGRKLDEVTVSAAGVRTPKNAAMGSLRISRMDADLHGVELSGGFKGFVADEATGSALVSYTDLSAVAPIGATVAYGGSGSKVKVTFAMPGLAALHRTVVSDIDVTSGNTLRLTANKVPKTGVAAIDRLIQSKINFTRKLVGLPDGITLASLRATPQGVLLTITGHHVTLTHGG